jgi:hypothetical protein
MADPVGRALSVANSDASLSMPTRSTVTGLLEGGSRGRTGLRP